MKVKIERENKQLEVVFSGTARELAKELNINPEAFLVVRNGEVVTKDAELSDEDEIKFVSVVSGG